MGTCSWVNCTVLYHAHVYLIKFWTKYVPEVTITLRFFELLCLGFLGTLLVRMIFAYTYNGDHSAIIVPLCVRGVQLNMHTRDMSGVHARV
jgi:hypothetical protein